MISRHLLQLKFSHDIFKIKYLHNTFLFFNKIIILSPHPLISVIGVIVLNKTLRSPTFTLIVFLAVSSLRSTLRILNKNVTISQSPPPPHITTLFCVFLYLKPSAPQISDFLLGSLHLSFVSLSWFQSHWLGM